MRAAQIILILWCVCLFSCNRQVVKLTPDIISGYGLDKNTLKNIQFYFESISIHSDSTVSKNEPTMFTRIHSNKWPVTEDSSAAKSEIAGKGDVIILKSKTPCKIIDVLENGKVLRVDFSTIVADFRLSYRSGYTFELVSDTVYYQGQPYLRSQLPLVQNIGLLSVNRKKLSAHEIVVEGHTIPENK